MDRDEYMALRKKIQDQANSDVKALDRTWKILNAAWGNGGEPKRQNKKVRFDLDKILPMLPSGQFTTAEAAQKLNSEGLKISPREMIYVLRSLSKIEKLTVSNREINKLRKFELKQ